MDERASKIGFILPKKLIKKGVYRNKIKRWLRKIVKDSGFIIDIVLLVNVCVAAIPAIVSVEAGKVKVTLPEKSECAGAWICA